ncbi:MAG: hypothetical protein U1G07_01300 [Verrucomicrobiota bacterium]
MKRLLAIVLLGSQALAQSIPPPTATGQFWRLHWYQRGLAYANPAYEGRFRVNSPEVVLHPSFGPRVEARENGLMLIQAEEDLRLVTAAELYLEMWGRAPWHSQQTGHCERPEHVSVTPGRDGGNELHLPLSGHQPQDH